MRALRRIVSGQPFAAVAGATVALLAVGAVMASAGSTPLQVCVSGKEGKTIVTPKGGVCKAGYTMRELGQEGPVGERGPQGEAGAQGEPGERGPAGSAIADRVRLAEPLVAATAPADASLTGATWTQGAEEVESLVGTLKVNVPNRSECGGPEGEPAAFSAQVKIDGDVVATSTLLNISPGIQTLMLEWKHPDGGEGLDSAYWLPEQGSEVGHSLVLQANDSCSYHHTRHYVVESVSIAVVGVH